MSYLAWFPALNLACTAVAAALWYVYPGLGFWPLLLAVIPWLIRFERSGRWDWRTPFDWPMLLFVITGTASVWAAYDRPAALAKFWMIVAAMLMFYAFMAFSLPGARSYGRNWGETPAWLLAGFGVLVTLYFVATHDWDELPAKLAAVDALGRSLQAPLPQLPGHRLHPNVVGGMLAMAAPFAAAVTWSAVRAQKWPAVLAGLASLGAILFGLLMTTSRGAWLALAAATGLAAMWLLLGLISGANAGRRRLIFTGLLLLGGVLLGIAVMMRPDLPARLAGGLPGLAGGGSRLDLYRNSLILAQDYPFIGAGLDGFMMLYSTYALLIHVGYLVHAHNLYLNVAIEQGLLALGALVWMWALFALALWRRAGEGALGLWLGAAALSLATILLHGVVEDAFYGSRALMLLFVPLAFAMPYPQRAEATSTATRRWVVPVAVGLALLIAGVVLWRPSASMALSNLTAVRQSRAELSQYTWPEWPIQDAVRRETDMAQITEGYRRALALNPANGSANRRLGQIELSRGAYEDALAHLERAYEGAPWDNATRQLYGEALLLTGQVERAQALLADVNNVQGQLVARAYWYRTEGQEDSAEILEAFPVE